MFLDNDQALEDTKIALATTKAQLGAAKATITRLRENAVSEEIEFVICCF
jgi:hypothetical protein